MANDSFIIRSIHPDTRAALDAYKRSSGISTDSKAVAALVRSSGLLRASVGELEHELRTERHRREHLMAMIRGFNAALSELKDVE